MEFKLPELGEGVNEGELVQWRVKKGDVVHHDQLLCDVMTDKATIEIPSPFDGKITDLLGKEGDTILVGQALLSYEGEGASPSAKSSAPSKEPPAPAPPLAKSQQNGQRDEAGPISVPVEVMKRSGERVLAAPSTRRFAREAGIDLESVSGSGPQGRILRQDIERTLKSGVPSLGRLSGNVQRAFKSGGEERVPFKGLRKKIAEKMRESKSTAAHFTYVEEADATQLVELRKNAKELGAKAGVKVTYLPFVMKAMVAALKQYPILNSSLDEEKGELVYKHYYNFGLSVQTDDGLIAPVIKNVDQKTVFEIAQDIEAVVNRARTKKLTLDDLKDGTVTLTNAGSIGGLFATPVINYPEVAIMGFNKIFKKPVVKNINGRDEIVIRNWTYFSISLDHRVVDGAIGAEFMNTFVRYIENPGLLLLEAL